MRLKSSHLIINNYIDHQVVYKLLSGQGARPAVFKVPACRRGEQTCALHVPRGRATHQAPFEPPEPCQMTLQAASSSRGAAALHSRRTGHRPFSLFRLDGCGFDAFHLLSWCIARTGVSLRALVLGLVRIGVTETISAGRVRAHGWTGETVDDTSCCHVAVCRASWAPLTDSDTFSIKAPVAAYRAVCTSALAA